MNTNHDHLESPLHSNSELPFHSTPEGYQKVPFCCVIPIPHGFELTSYCKPKLVYLLNCVGLVTETCRKTVKVDDCGNAEVDLHMLKVKGCIPFIANVKVKPICEQTGCSSEHHSKEISICCSESVCVDHVLKCSVERIPHHHLDCHNVVVCDLKTIPIREDHCQFVKIMGNFQFHYAKDL
ncbi:ABC transporter permease [Brevibacillus halotolerans]|uniref:ABC transporter permease n=1 Tax=Brevibacillus TaxID=55080 RepID=UPI00215B9C5C|nr:MULTISPECIES: ABC transporter permease [Brevibacillus]MCR8964200.1 ABC transporter permease [Brevibacillus laterosporus]MCZ0836355.1 ABC transporter permease [Brevibacillus halotolerans]